MPWGHRFDTTAELWRTECHEADCNWVSGWFVQLPLANRAAAHHRRLVHLRASSETHR